MVCNGLYRRLRKGICWDFTEESDTAKMNSMFKSEMVKAFFGSWTGRWAGIEFTRSEVIKWMEIHMEILNGKLEKTNMVIT